MSPHLSSQIPILFFSKGVRDHFLSPFIQEKIKLKRRRRETGRMQSRLLVVVRWYSFFPLFPRCLSNYPLFTTSQCCGAGDPAVHSEFPQVSFYFSSFPQVLLFNITGVLWPAPQETKLHMGLLLLILSKNKVIPTLY